VRIITKKQPSQIGYVNAIDNCLTVINSKKSYFRNVHQFFYHRKVNSNLPRYSKRFAVFAFICVGFFACNKDEVTGIQEPPELESLVKFDLSRVPYDSLSTYNFFDGLMSDQEPAYGVIPYDLITTLFTDYAHKHRFVWMPDSVSATYNSDNEVLNFPDGTVLIKSFYYDHVQPADETKIIETRLLIKVNGNWEFANYIWNSDQTAATLNLVGDNVDLSWIDENDISRDTRYRIPSEAECLNCHKINLEPIPIGPKPQNLNRDLMYEDGTMNQLQKWKDLGLISGNIPALIETIVNWEDDSNSLQSRVRAYVDVNCSHCHANEKHCDYRAPRFAWSETTDPANLGICVVPDDIPIQQLTHIVSSGNIPRSALHYRLNSTDETVRMPLLGRTLVHEEAVQLIEQWINTLNPPCN
jgi:uncharacterized repeat protein (TIGR03806 family)